MSRQVTLEVPDEALRAAQIVPEGIERAVLEAALLRWFEEGRLSQGQTATALGLKRGEFFDLLQAHRMSPIQMNTTDLRENFRSA